MLDIKFIKENKALVEKAVVDKQMASTVDITAILHDYDDYLALLKKVEIHRNLKNTLSKDISKVLPAEKEKLLSEAKKLKDELDIMEKELELLKNSFNEKILTVPNVYAGDVPVGRDENENIIERKEGKVREFDFTPKDHIELGEKLGIIDINTAGSVSGSRFCYLLNEAAMIQFALIQFCLNTVTNEEIIGKIAKQTGNLYSKPFSPVVPPVFIKPEVMKRMDRLDPIEERYYIQSDDLVLIGSAEHTLGPLLADKTVEIKDLPIRYIGYSTAFRRESGSYGKDVKGIFRVHQFDKLEMESFTTAQDGDAEQRLIVGIQEYLVSQLGIPYQIVNVCTGDMGKPDYRHIDIDCWMPGQNRYRETHTSDYMTDYQSRRLNACYKDADGVRKFLHMNDATALAIGRILIAIIENYQNKDGSVTVPEVLRKYLSFSTIPLKK